MTTTGEAFRPKSAASLGLGERRRLERDLHDGAQQRLVALALTLRLAREKLDAEPAETGRLLDRSREELDQALRELRDLARGIHPAVLADRGLRAAVAALAERAPLPVEIIDELSDRRLPEQVELAAYFVVSEALTNVAKHASAMKASVALTQRDERLAVEVSDDGLGGADFRRGTGLRGLAVRVAAIDGRLEVDSKPGRGTIVRADLPCQEAARGSSLRPEERRYAGLVAEEPRAAAPVRDAAPLKRRPGFLQGCRRLGSSRPLPAIGSQRATNRIRVLAETVQPERVLVVLAKAAV